MLESEPMIEVSNQQDLNTQLASNSRVLALFHASWCPFCRSFVGIFDKHAKNPGKDTCIKVRIDEDENPLWEIYELDAVPSIILFENGQVKHRLDCHLGAGLNEKQFTHWLASP